MAARLTLWFAAPEYRRGPRSLPSFPPCGPVSLYNTQKDCDNTVTFSCMRDGQEEECRNLAEDFMRRCVSNHLQLNTSKTKRWRSMWSWSRPTHLGLQLDDRLEHLRWQCQLIKLTNDNNHGLLLLFTIYLEMGFAELLYI